jgi:hypothetical protein
VTLVEQSEALHERVRRFARSPSEQDFETLGLLVARFQAEYSPGFARLVRTRGSRLDRLDDVPGVPCEAFRLARVAVHPPELDEVRFATSGTTAAPGLHCMRTTRTYRELALGFGARALTSTWEGPGVVLALARPPGRPATSSLGFMMRAMIEAFDGRPLDQASEFDAEARGRWLIDESGVDVVGLSSAAELARARGEPLLVLATAFALVALLDALKGRTIPAPKRTIVMQTGGFKGKTREVAPEQLRAAVARAFGIEPCQIVGEYGMTELTSQLYERGGAGAKPPSDPPVYLEPPWLRVTPVDPATLEPVPTGEVGIARVVDLGNVDSAVIVIAEDLVRRTGGGIELHGRRAGAPARGCSLSVEALLRRS